MDVLELQLRVRELEEKVEQLRLSRRVLMCLLEKMEKERLAHLVQLERENRKLHRANCRYARSLWKKNMRIMELESRLREILSLQTPSH